MKRSWLSGWNGIPPRYVCRRCGVIIPFGENGSELRRLAVYCKGCAEKMIERQERRNRAAPEVHTVRVKRCSYRTKEGTLVECYTEYRGTFPSLVISD